MKRLIPWLMVCICLGLSVWSGNQIQSQRRLLSLRLDEKEDGISRQTVERMKESSHLAAFMENGRQTVTVPATGQRAEVPVIRTAGDNSLVTGSWLADGIFGLGGIGECMLSKGAALVLFGSEKIAGLTVIADGKEWLVRGVLDSAAELILLPASRDTLMTNIEFSFSDSGDNQSEAETICFRYGISEKRKIIDYGFFSAVARLFMWLPFLTCLFLLKIEKRNIMSGSGSEILRYVTELIFWFGLFVFLFQAFRFPSGYIPARWSDFGFWAARWKESLEQMDVLFSSALLKDRMLRDKVAICLFSSVAASGLIMNNMLIFQKR